jgi:hypothetical protein
LEAKEYLMSSKRRMVWIGIMVVIASVSLAVFGLPYQPLEVMASELQQYDATPIVPCLQIGDQDARLGEVTAGRVCATRRAWLVIYRDEAGAPGPPIGMTLVPFGVSDNVIVEIDLEQATPQLFAQVHQDLGQPEVFDPADTVESGPVEFNVTLAELPTGPTATDTPESTSTPMASATPTPTAEPSGLASLPASLVLAVLCLAFLVGLALIAIALLPLLRRRADKRNQEPPEA